jgi:hypothetical protein
VASLTDWKGKKFHPVLVIFWNLPVWIRHLLSFPILYVENQPSEEHMQLLLIPFVEELHLLAERIGIDVQAPMVA